VVFYDDQVVAVRLEDGRIMVPVRPLCKALGIDYAAQRQRVLRDVVLSESVQGVVVTTTPSASGRGGGPQEMLCLPLEYLNGWIFGISAKRVKPEIQDRLIRYQRECYTVLHEAFQEGRLTTDPVLGDLLQADTEAVQAYKMLQAMVKIARNQIILEAKLETHSGQIASHETRLDEIEAAIAPGTAVSEEQASQISQAVKAVAMTLSKQTKRNEFGAVYGEVYRKFEVTSYKMVPRSKFEEVMTFLTEWHQSLVADSPF
ncbi:MAG: hypothetical protein GY943_15420, partial [Chloroflexi bacterium]|nr:hypothetical protein [Chloroflexota bacterium]